VSERAESGINTLLIVIVVYCRSAGVAAATKSFSWQCDRDGTNGQVFPQKENVRKTQGKKTEVSQAVGDVEKMEHNKLNLRVR